MQTLRKIPKEQRELSIDTLTRSMQQFEGELAALIDAAAAVLRSGGAFGLQVPLCVQAVPLSSGTAAA